jgi:hypothetical protein
MEALDREERYEKSKPLNKRTTAVDLKQTSKKEFTSLPIVASRSIIHASHMGRGTNDELFFG